MSNTSDKPALVRRDTLQALTRLRAPVVVIGVFLLMS